jgi:hypothetical protein
VARGSRRRAAVRRDADTILCRAATRNEGFAADRLAVWIERFSERAFEQMRETARVKRTLSMASTRCNGVVLAFIARRLISRPIPGFFKTLIFRRYSPN